MPTISRLLDHLMQAQFGIVSYAQLNSHGWTRTMIDKAVASGHLVVVQRGVFRCGGAPLTHNARLLAACLAAGPRTAVSHRACAHAFGLRQAVGPVETSVPYEQCPAPRGVVQHRSTDLVPAHVTTRFGLPITTPTRLLVDVGSVVRVDELKVIADAAVLKGLTTWPQVYAMVDEVARRGRRGIGPLRAVLADRPLGGRPIESVLEPVMARILRDHHVARVFYQYEVCVNGHTYRIDFGIPHVKLGLEVDGLEWHGTRDAAINDRVRRRALKVAGWELLEYTAGELHRRPSAVAREVLAIVAEREALLAPPKL